MFKDILGKLEIMQEQLYKKVSHGILFWVSMIFSVMLFAMFTSNPFYSVIWATFAVAVELTKAFLTKEVKTIYKSKHPWILASFITLYLATALVSGVATYGAVKMTLEQQEVYSGKMEISSDNIQFNIDQIDKKIERINRSADSSIAEKEKMNNSDDIYYSGISKMTADTELAEKELADLLEERTVLTNSLREEAKNTTNASKDVFELIGADIGLTGQKTLFYIFVVLIVILEIALFATTDPFKHHSIETSAEEEYEVVLRYIEALEKENGSVILNSDDTISEVTGIPKKDCKRYRKLLKEITHRGKSLLSDNNRMNWNSNTIMKVVRNYFGEEV